MSSKIIGILPMAGLGSRIQPLAFSKELYPVSFQKKHFAVSEFSVRAMLQAGADEIKIVVRPEKLDIVKYYSTINAPVSFYSHHPSIPYSLPESSLYPLNALNDDDICLFGLPDTIFSPSTAYVKVLSQLKTGADICLGLFEVEDASKYDSVARDSNDNVTGVLVKQSPPLSNWIWGIWGANVRTLKLLRKEINKQDQKEKLLGVSMNQLSKKKQINFKAVEISRNYFDIGTMEAVIKANEVINNFEL